MIMTVTGLVKIEFYWVPSEAVSSPGGWEPLLYSIVKTSNGNIARIGRA